MRSVFAALLMVALLATPAMAKVGDSVAAFGSGPLVQQLLLTYTGQNPVDGGRLAHRYVSDDRAITVELIVGSAIIEQQIMYLPMTEQRGYQVSMFLQDALGSLVGSQTGLVAFRAAVVNRSETSLKFGGMTMWFTPMQGGLLRVLVRR